MLSTFMQKAEQSTDHKKKFCLLSVTLPTQKNCPYPKNLIGLREKDFL